MGGDLRADQETVLAFMRRAERILATSAAQREDLATLGSTFKVQVRSGEAQHRIERSHLPSPQLLEAAALIRPVLLQKEPVHLGRVVNAIWRLSRGASEPTKAHVDGIKSTWRQFLEAPRWHVMVARKGDPEQTRLTDVEIADLWFNAHVWHDDRDKQWALRHISEDECLVSATVWVSDRIHVVKAVRRLVQEFRQEGQPPA